MRYLPPKGTAGLPRARVTLPPGHLPQPPQPEHTTLVDALEAQGERPRAHSRATVWLVALAVALPVVALLAYGFTRNPRALPSPLGGRPPPGAPGAGRRAGRTRPQA